MVRSAALMLLLLAAPLPWDRKWAEEGWLFIAEDTNNARYFARAEDLQNTKNLTPEIWIRGNHVSDSDVPYRESKTFYHFDCRRRTYYRIAGVAYAANGKVHSSTDSAGVQVHVIPGSIGEAWFEAACPK